MEVENSIENEFTKQELRDLKDVFQVYDPSNTGSLTVGDLKKVLKVLGFKCSSRRLHELMKEKDIGRDGLITFKNVLQLVYRLQGDAYDLHSEIEQAFQFLDVDCDGQLSDKDLQAAAKSVGLKLKQSDIDEMIEEADLKGTGQLSLQEFIQVMQRTALFNTEIKY